MSQPTQSAPYVESFTDDETAFLLSYVTNTDKHVFALTNLPEVVKGALFARYSRSEKSLRRLLLDEFSQDLGAPPRHGELESHRRAESLYHRVFAEYGDDSIAQLGSVHVACEGISNIVTKLVERGRIMSYLEQSTRYVPYTDKPGGEWRYHTPDVLDTRLRNEYRRVTDGAFASYSSLLPVLERYLVAKFVPTSTDESGAYRRAVRAKALDILRGLLPAATRSNVGVYGSGQAYELLVMRLRASGNDEAIVISDLLLNELRKVIPSFVARVDRADRGVVWTNYLDQTRRKTEAFVRGVLVNVQPFDSPEVTLVDFDPEGEIKVVAAAMYSASTLPDLQLLDIARRMSYAERLSVLKTYVGNRTNRRHRPGRAFERTSYRFDVLGDYGAFRDLQRHRLLSLDWQTLTVNHGYIVPELVEAAGAMPEWKHVMQEGARLHQLLAESYSIGVASYAVPMAYKIRYFMEMNAREAMHLIELRSSPQGHENYRKIVLKMHSLVAEAAGHRAIAEAMRFASTESQPLERLAAERAAGH